MRKTVLAAAVSSAALLFASGANAGDDNANWYSTIFAGAAFGDSVDLDASEGGTPLFPTYEVPMETGYLLGWTLGYDNAFNTSTIQFRPEVEVSFRQQDVDLEEVITFLIGPPPGDPDPLNLAVDMLTLLGNVWVDFDFGGGFTPYVGGGVGIGFADFGILESDDLVWQFGGGVNFDVGKYVFLGIGYRYIGGDFEESTDLAGFIAPNTIDAEFEYRAHEVMANVGVRF